MLRNQRAIVRTNIRDLSIDPHTGYLVICYDREWSDGRYDVVVGRVALGRLQVMEEGRLQDRGDRVRQ